MNGLILLLREVAAAAPLDVDTEGGEDMTTDAADAAEAADAADGGSSSTWIGWTVSEVAWLSEPEEPPEDMAMALEGP